MNVILLGSIATYKIFAINLSDVYAPRHVVTSTGVTALINKNNALFNPSNNTQTKYYDKYLAIDPNYKVTLNNKGISLYKLGNCPQALQYFNKALTIDPNYKVALINKQNAISKMRNGS